MGVFRKKAQPVWYVLQPATGGDADRRGRREGPYSRATIATLVAERRLPPDALLWTNERIFPDARRPNRARCVRLMEWRRLDQLPDPVLRQMYAAAAAAAASASASAPHAPDAPHHLPQDHLYKPPLPPPPPPVPTLHQQAHAHAQQPAIYPHHPAPPHPQQHQPQPSVYPHHPANATNNGPPHAPPPPLH